jgi:tetratricopeptide (TPR) repeat protein
LHLILEELEEAEAAYSEARRLFDELGVAQSVGYTTMMLGRIVERRGDDAGAERLLRESIRVLQGLGDRSVLCEAQRRLAQLLLKRGRLDEAERLALNARETVGREDATSLVTTAMALGIVRAAQGRDEEAEALLRKSVEDARGFKLLQIEPLKNLAQFLRERGRTEEAAPFEARWAELSPAEAKLAARIA